MRWERMRPRAVLPILIAGLVPVLVALPGVYLGVVAVVDALRHPPASGIIGLGLALGFWLLVGSLFVICLSVLLTGVALDVRDLRNRQTDRRTAGTE